MSGSKDKAIQIWDLSVLEGINKVKVNSFLRSWAGIYRSKYESNPLIQVLIGNKVNTKTLLITELDLISISKYEPNLPTKYLSFTKLIRDGIFSCELEEIAR